METWRGTASWLLLGRLYRTVLLNAHILGGLTDLSRLLTFTSGKRYRFEIWNGQFYGPVWTHPKLCKFTRNSQSGVDGS